MFLTMLSIASVELGRFGAGDWSIVAIYLVGVLALGVYCARKQRTANDFFLASHKIPAWAASLSLLATSLSAVTFIGAPENAFSGNLTYLILNLSVILAAIVVARFFLPAFYKHNVTTVYELLAVRFGGSSQRAASLMFLVGRLFASGARLFVASIPLALILFGDIEPNHLALAIAIVAIVATLYTLTGGIAAVIWTDTAQLIILIGAALLVCVMLLREIPDGFAGAIETLQSARAPDGSGKLTALDMRTDPAIPFTLWSAIFGFSLLNLAAYGADQDLAQRLLTCKSAAKASASMIFAAVMSLPIAGVFLAVGLLLYVYTQRVGPLSTDDGRQVFLVYILQHTPAGVRGVMIAGLFAAAMSSLDSALNAMSSAAVSDFYRPLRRGKSDGHYLLAARLGVIGFAVLLAGCAIGAAHTQAASGDGLIEFALGVMIYAYAGLLAVFLTAIFTKRGTEVSIVLALLTGFFSAFALARLPAINSSLSLGFEEDAMNLSAGWRMLIATAIAFLVAVAPRGHHDNSSQRAHS